MLSQVLRRSLFNGLILNGDKNVQSLRIIVSRPMSSESQQEDRWMTESSRDESRGTALDPFVKVNHDQLGFLDTLQPPAKRSFNFAAYVNESETLQALIKLGVSLYDVENVHRRSARLLTKLDFERDCVPYIKFLIDNGLKQKNVGRFLSEYPTIFQVHLDDLQVRINYYESKGFSKKMIASALNKSSRFIAHKTKTIDHKLGQLQVAFGLPGHIVRRVVVTHPEVISLPNEQYDLTKFVLHEEFGFKPIEAIRILEKEPTVLDILRPVLVERLELIHNTIGLNHGTIVRFPRLITGPRLDIKFRSAYLAKLKRDQYDPKLPLYVPPSALYSISDEKFCLMYTKTSLKDFKLFIKDM